MIDVQERISWADFRKAYSRIDAARSRRQKTGSQIALAAADGLDEALMEMQDAFQHHHVRSDNGDKCALCDLDIRNEIHVRK